MGDTDAHGTGIAVNAGPAITHRPFTKARSDVNGFQCLIAALGVPGQEGEKTRTVDMQPVQLACQAHSRLIGMLYLTHAHPLGDLLHSAFQSLCRFGHPAYHCSLRDVAATQIAERMCARQVPTDTDANTLPALVLPVHTESEHPPRSESC